MRCEFRQGVLQWDLWARRSVSNPGVSISMGRQTRIVRRLLNILLFVSFFLFLLTFIHYCIFHILLMLGICFSLNMYSSNLANILQIHNFTKWAH